MFLDSATAKVCMNDLKLFPLRNVLSGMMSSVNFYYVINHVTPVGKKIESSVDFEHFLKYRILTTAIFSSFLRSWKTICFSK